MEMFDACKGRLPLELSTVEQQPAQPSHLQTHSPLDSRPISGLRNEKCISQLNLDLWNLIFIRRKLIPFLCYYSDLVLLTIP